MKRLPLILALLIGMVIKEEACGIIRFWKTPEVVGRVIDATTKKPIPNAVVSASAGTEEYPISGWLNPGGQNAEYGTLFDYKMVTDESGEFRIPAKGGIIFGIIAEFDGFGVSANHPLYEWGGDSFTPDKLKLIMTGYYYRKSKGESISKILSNGEIYIDIDELDNDIKKQVPEAFRERVKKGILKEVGENKGTTTLFIFDEKGFYDDINNDPSGLRQRDLKEDMKKLNIKNKRKYFFHKILEDSSYWDRYTYIMRDHYLYKEGKIHLDIEMESLEEAYVRPIVENEERNLLIRLTEILDRMPSIFETYKTKRVDFEQVKKILQGVDEKIGKVFPDDEYIQKEIFELKKSVSEIYGKSME